MPPTLTHRRELRADVLLVRNIQALLRERGKSQDDLAFWCGHKPPWISKIIRTHRGIKLEDVGRVADFFGLSVSQLFQPGISTASERRQHERRSGADRRSSTDRRNPEARKLTAPKHWDDHAP